MLPLNLVMRCAISLFGLAWTFCLFRKELSAVEDGIEESFVDRLNHGVGSGESFVAAQVGDTLCRWESLAKVQKLRVLVKLFTT